MPQFDYADVPGAIPDTADSVTAGDFAKTFGAGVADVGSNLAGGARYAHEAMGNENLAEITRGLQDIFGGTADNVRGTMNPEATKRLSAQMTTPEFWERPGLSTALKVTGMLPSVVALAVPAGLLAETTAAVALGGAALGAGASIDEFYQKLDAMPDADLQAQSKKYATLREILDEPTARAKFAREAQGWAPAINALIGAGTALVGPAGIAARRIAGGTSNVIGAGERGALGAGAIAGAEGAATNALQGGVEDVLAQQADVDANFAKDMDYARSVNAAVEGGALGGLLGSVAGSVLHNRKPSTPKVAADTAQALDKVDAVEPVATSDVVAPQVQNGTASAVPAKPVESPQVGNPQNAPEGSERVYPKGKKRSPKSSEPVVEPVQPAAPDATQAAAIASQEPTTETPDAAAALARLLQEGTQPPPVPPQVTPPPVPAPDNVAAAMQRTMPPELPAEPARSEGGPTPATVPAPQEQVSSQGPAGPPAPAPLDTGMNVQESGQTLSAQIAQIGTGNRKAAMFPRGTVVPADAARPGLRRHTNGRGTFIYDPKLTNVKEINRLSKAGKENELLGMGPVAKPEAMARVAQGEQPVVVTERQPNGTEVKAAVGTDQTARQQVQALEQGKTPGNVVAVESPDAAMQRRNMVVEPKPLPVAEAPAAAPSGPPRTGRVLRRIGDEDQVAKPDVTANMRADKIKLDENLEPVVDAEGNTLPVKEAVSHKGKAADEAKADQIKRSLELAERHPPTAAEDDYLKKIPARDAVVARAQRMVDEAKEAGIPIKQVLRRAKNQNNKAAGEAPGVQLLTLANELVKAKEKNKQGAKLTEAVGRFRVAEAEVRGGYSEEMLANRRAEGDEKMAARKSGTSGEQASGAIKEASTKEEIEAETSARVDSDAKDTAAAASAAREAENEITTGTSTSKRPILLDAGTEIDKDTGRERARAASGDKLAADAERKAKLIAEMNAKYGTPKKTVTEKNALRIGPPEAGKINRREEPGGVKIYDTKNWKLVSPGQIGLSPEWKLLDRKNNEVRYVDETYAKKIMRVWNESPAKADELVSGERNALRVERNPTEAQIAAGNYKKGHRNVEGLDFSIENPKGALRRGRGPQGDWSVRMPADYGYIRRTTGADGDHIDAYDGRNGRRFFIVDQLDERTGEFDEHKVMMRFTDEAAARDAYLKAFSDGRGEQRLGHIQEVSLPELKAWLKQGDHQQSHLEHVVRDMDKVNFDVPEGPGMAVLGGGRVTPIRVAKAAGELAALDFTKMPGVGGVLGKFFQSKLAKLAGDMDVHYISQADMDRISTGQKGNLGLFIHDPNDAAAGQLFISDRAADGVGVGSKAHVLLHELTHQVTVREVKSSRTFIEQIGSMMEAANEHLDQNLQRYDLDPEFANRLDYGLSSPTEFIAEAFSNPKFQEFLTHVPAPEALVKQLKLQGPSRSMWDMFRAMVKKAIQKVTGELPQFESLLDSIMRVGENVTKVHEFEQLALRTGDEPHVRGAAEQHIQRDALNLFQQASTAVERLQRDANTMERGPFALKLRTLDNIAKIADVYFGESNPVRKVYNGIEKMRVTAEGTFNKSAPLMRRMIDLRSKNPEVYREFSSLLHDATVANVHPDVLLTDPKNAHLGKKRVVGDAVWSKSQHAALASRYNALPDDYKAAWHDLTKHYRDTQNAMSLGIIQNRILKGLGIDDAALAQRIHEGTATDADRNLVGADLFDAIEDAGELSKIEGPYVPLIRRGDHVVKGRYAVPPPSVPAKRLSDNEFEFKNEKEATAYAAAQKNMKARVKKVWVDETTGEMHETDPATGKTHKVSSKDLNAEARYRVEVQNEHVEFVDGNRAANRRKDELAAQGLTMDMVVPRRFEVGGRQATELSASLQALSQRIERSDAFKQSTPTQQAMLRQAIEHAAMASHGSTRVQSKALPRRGVAGYSEDLIQNMGEYGESSSRYLAKLEHMPEVEAGMKEMEARLKQDESKTNQYGRTAIRNEVTRRVQGDNGFEEGDSKFSPFVKRAMAVSFIDKLASPAYSVINAMQPAMVTMPYLAGRFGIAKSATEMGRAYNDLAAFTIVRKGLKETARRIRGKEAPDDFFANAKAGLKSADERAAFDYAAELGIIDPNGGLEIRNLARDYTGVGGKIDRGLGYLEGVTREMPRAVEAVNRMTTYLASYRLERGRGSSHEAAMRYAQDAVESTQFNYSPTNSAPFMNHPLAKMAFQFKKYGQGMYQLIGGQIGKAYRNSSPGERAEAVKTLIAIAGTHMAMAGALGLPTEPFKYLVMASGLVGGPQWGDVEDEVRKVAANVLGKTGGEVFSRGLPRLIGLDLSRMGLDSVTSFGEPRSSKDADVKSWFFDTLGGPIAGLAFDWGKGLNLIANGDYAKGAEKLVPMKVASDTLRAYRQATEGKRKASGEETSAPYNFAEATLRAAGFGNRREAEEGAADRSFRDASKSQSEKRTALVNAWTSASPSGKQSAMAAITKFNQSVPAEVRITPKELTAKLKKMNEGKNVRGVITTRRDKHLREERSYYNVD